MSCVQQFPQHLLDLVKTSKYVHVATCSTDCIPSVSLMNYIYVPGERSFAPEDRSCDYIVFATLNNTEKYQNIISNPIVSLLFHDWITAKNLSLKKRSLSKSSASDQEEVAEGSGTSHSSKLLNLLQELNQSELFQMSATIRGHAAVIAPNSEESSHYKKLLLRTNPDAHVFIEDAKTVIIKVKIQSAKVTDSENNTSIYT
ncbi:hypothetical protein HG535_0C06080 [Zygotorulaspora mrakii]|uniref:Pyridoxamine 5'-phosphate oxidase N-terminal domain-containing protein n=1 Tax=Zygotorulaspora mrakii TaxID=42260 RepID=A0A7H9B156_ZYGMR|nr:uncharacterized protein HG535_0C06080 [Zygotorulaspora mrakii]QLG72253.1 hypothetical protein HG535_0C06080 [Zygotorulaspora mrakii]